MNDDVKLAETAGGSSSKALSVSWYSRLKAPRTGVVAYHPPNLARIQRQPHLDGKYMVSSSSECRP